MSDDSCIGYLLSYLYIFATIMHFFSVGNDAAPTGFLDMPSNSQPITVGVIVGTCVALTIGVTIFIFILRCVKT